jgi:tyrosyl-tRNA synthetase
MSRIRDLELLSGSELNTVKLLLADEATGLLHGKECLPSIHATADALFKAASGGKGGSETTESLDSLDKLQLTVEDITSEKGANILNLLVKTGWVSSKNGARRLIAKGGVRLNGVKVETEHVTVELDAFDTEGRLKLTASKKVHCLLLKP